MYHRLYRTMRLFEKLLKRLAAPTLLTLPAALASGVALAAPSVAVDLAPVHSLTAMVMEGVGEPVLIVPSNASPHHYAMRPSEARALARADLVVWLGPEALPWFAAPLAALAPDAIDLPLSEAPGVYLRRLGDVLERGKHPDRDTPDHDDHDDSDQSGHAAHGPIDPHLWLDPQNAVAWLEPIAEALSGVDPENAARYRANAARRKSEIVALTAELTALLAPVRAERFIVFHDAYGYFEDRFGLNSAGAVALSDGAKPGARRMAEIHRAAVATGARCIFSEPQFDSKVVAAIAEETGAAVAELDPLGARLKPGPELYGALLRDLAAAAAACLAGR